jgi:hypothetical protein
VLAWPRPTQGSGDLKRSPRCSFGGRWHQLIVPPPSSPVHISADIACPTPRDVGPLLALRLFVASGLLRGLKPLHGLLYTDDDAFERDDLGGGHIQLIPSVERILSHEPLQKIDVALTAPRSLVQAGGFSAAASCRT